MADAEPDVIISEQFNEDQVETHAEKVHLIHEAEVCEELDVQDVYNRGHLARCARLRRVEERSHSGLDRLQADGTRRAGLGGGVAEPPR